MNPTLKATLVRLAPLSARLRLPPVARAFLFAHRLDIALLAASAICFGLFARGSIEFQRLSGIQGPIAHLSDGEAERKPSGTTSYVSVTKGSNLYDLDAVWVPKLGHATLSLDDGTNLELGEKTLLVLKRPFKSTGPRHLEDEVKVVKGRVKMTGRQPRTIDSVDDKPSELPKFENAFKDRVVPAKLYPPDDGLLLRRETDRVKLTFTWVDPVKGYLVVQSKETGRVSFAEVRGEHFSNVELDQGSEYFWQLVDVDRKPLAGPFRFELRVLTDESAKEALKQQATGANKRPTEIYW
jgi:hypothetical protein